MVNEESLLEKLRQKGSEVAQKQTLLEEKLSQRPNKPQVGDIFVFARPKHPKLTGLQWVILRSHDKNPQQFLTVPTDGVPMVGSNDIELSKKALCNPLTLRCHQSLWIRAKDFDMKLRVGFLEKWDLQRALDKEKQVLTGKLRSTISQQQMDDDLDYEEWMEHVIQGREVLKQFLDAPKFVAKESIGKMFSHLYDKLVVLLSPKQIVYLTIGIILGFSIHPLYTAYIVDSDIKSGVVTESIDDTNTITNDEGITLAELESEQFQRDLENFQFKGQPSNSEEVPLESDNSTVDLANIHPIKQTVTTDEKIVTENIPLDFNQLSPEDWLWEIIDKINDGKIVEAMEMLEQFHAKYPDYSP